MSITAKPKLVRFLRNVSSDCAAETRYNGEIHWGLSLAEVRVNSHPSCRRTKRYPNRVAFLLFEREGASSPAALKLRGIKGLASEKPPMSFIGSFLEYQSTFAFASVTSGESLKI